MKILFKNEKGIAALIAIIMVGMLTLIGLAVMSTSDDEVTITGNALQETRAFYAAEAGLDIAAAMLESEYDSTNAPPSVLPAGIKIINDCDVTFASFEDGPAKIDRINSGSLSGLNSFSKAYLINSTSISSLDNAQIEMSQVFETVMIPIFQWAIFFNDDLWTQPAFDLTVEGRTHVNGDMYLRSSTNLSFLDKVTASGDINYGFPYATTSPGDIQFSDPGGNLVSMNQSGTWIDANTADWYTDALSLWSGNVQDKAFGQSDLNLPVADNADAHKIIERAASNPDSYQNKATFQILDGVPMAKIGSVWQNVSASLPAGTITSNGSEDFYDSHEKKTVQNTQVDISLLRTSSYFPTNGILYISDQRNTTSTTMNGASLINGTELGNPLTIVCENPLFIEGDYNTVNKQPASTISDAVTFLSNNWDPALSTQTYTSRSATQTTVNVSIVTGDITPNGNNYGGGLENLPRFLEDWNGTEFKFRGSMVQMWRSQQAQGTWRYISASDAYYSAPARNWGFDNDLEDMTKLPPGTPMVRIFLRKGWNIENVGYTNAE